MCSIGGFSLAEGSTVNARGLSHALLSAMEVRGTDAAGFAFTTRKGASGSHKAAVRGGQLPLKGLPREADAVILHTRMWTTCAPSDNRNNHPLSSPDGNIRLVHNGVIYNHDEVRVEHNFDQLPDVDSAVIPAVLSRFGVAGLDYLAGDAALVWLDDSTNNSLHIARPSRNPVVFARLLDGSVVFASTERILGSALKAASLVWLGDYPDQFSSLDEGGYLTITDSVVEYQDSVGWNDDYWTQRTYRKFSAGSEVSVWDDTEPELDAAGFDDEGMWRDSGVGHRYYLFDHAGDYQWFTSISTLLECVFWYSDVSGGQNIVDKGDNLSWVNHISDIGTIEVDGSLSSWADYFPTDLVDSVEAQIVYDGLQLLNGSMMKATL